MTITKQELTLFGGWAKVLTPLRIELGVSKLLDTASPSISKKIPGIVLRYYDHDPDKPALINHIWDKDWDGKPVYREIGEWEIEQKSEIIVSQSLQEHFKRAAFVRFVEAWSETFGIDQNKFLRALSGTEKLKRSFAGMLGSMNGKAIEKVSGQWKITDRSRLYPSIKLMPEDGIERIRLLAYERKQSKTTVQSPAES